MSISGTNPSREYNDSPGKLRTKAADTITLVRQNHALEHATINVLSEKHKSFSAQGNSTQRGFNLNIYGKIGEEEVVGAVEEAFGRLQQGEEKLALHPNCGTVLLTTATLAVLAVQATLSLEQRRQRRAAPTNLSRMPAKRFSSW